MWSNTTSSRLSKPFRTHGSDLLSDSATLTETTAPALTGERSFMEDDDPLAKFRRPGTTRAERRAEPPPPPGALKPYCAFEAKDKLICLEIRRVLGTTHAPTWAYLLNISFDHDFFTGVVLHFTFMRVKVRGKNLKELITAIKLRKCEFIQDF